MSALDALLILSLILAALSLGYWLRAAHRAAQRNREVFAPRAPVPALHERRELERLCRDAARDADIEARWRAAVALNIARRPERYSSLPALLRKQAG